MFGDDVVTAEFTGSQAVADLAFAGVSSIATRLLNTANKIPLEARVLSSVERALGHPVPRIEDTNDRAKVDEHSAVVITRYDALHLFQHQMLGAPENIQDTAPRMEAQGHICLMQLDSDWGVHKSFTFCDSGMAQFWIKPQDLAERRFDRAFGTTDGG